MMVYCPVCLGWERQLHSFEENVFEERGEIGFVRFVLRFLMFKNEREVAQFVKEWYGIEAPERCCEMSEAQAVEEWYGIKAQQQGAA